MAASSSAVNRFTSNSNMSLIKRPQHSLRLLCDDLKPFFNYKLSPLEQTTPEALNVNVKLTIIHFRCL